MVKLIWDKVGERRFENGVDHGVLYRRNLVTGAYDMGYVWNGLTAVNESPSGAESSKQYADNIPYLNLQSAEEFGASIEAFTYPDEFAFCDGTLEIAPGIQVGQQARETFGFHYRTRVGNDVNPDAGYKLHLIYGALAAPTEKGNTTINDTPEAMTFSWEITTTPVEIGTIGGISFRPTAHLTVSSLDVPAEDLLALETILYGTAGTGDPEVGGTAPRLPLPAEFVTLFGA